MQGVLHSRLRRHDDQIVRRFMQDAAANGQFRLERIDLMQRLDDETGHRADFRGNFETVAARDRRRTTCPRCARGPPRRRLVAVAASRHHAGKFVFDIGGKRHGATFSSAFGTSGQRCASHRAAHSGRARWDEADRRGFEPARQDRTAGWRRRLRRMMRTGRIAGSLLFAAHGKRLGRPAKRRRHAVETSRGTQRFGTVNKHVVDQAVHAVTYKGLVVLLAPTGPRSRPAYPQGSRRTS